MWLNNQVRFGLFITLSGVSWLFLFHFSMWPLGSICLCQKHFKKLYWDWNLHINLGRTEVSVIPNYSIHECEIWNVFTFVQTYFHVFQECFPPIDLAFFLSLFLSISSFWCFWEWRLLFDHIFNYSLLCIYTKYWVLSANFIPCHFTQFLLFKCLLLLRLLAFQCILSTICGRNSFLSSFLVPAVSNYSLLIECGSWFCQYNVTQQWTQW